MTRTNRRPRYRALLLASLAMLLAAAHRTIPGEARHVAAIESRMAEGAQLRYGIGGLFRTNGIKYSTAYHRLWGIASYTCAKDCFWVSVGIFGHVLVLP